MNPIDYKAEPPLLIVVLLLLTLGVLVVYSASSFKAEQLQSDSNYFLKRHLIKVAIALVLMILAAKIDYRIWLRISPALLILSVILLLFLLVSPTVPEIRGSKRWLVLAGFQLQPSDFAKLALILFLSNSLTRRRDFGDVAYGNFVFHISVAALVIIPILLQPDFGTAALIALVAVTLIFVSGEKLRYMLALIVTAAPVAILFLMRGGYHKMRILKFLESLRGGDVHWQAQQSLVALGNGHILGEGLGGSRQKYLFLPDPFTDFIYAIVGEELGFIGAAVVLLLFLVIIWIGLHAAMNAPEPGGKLLATGLVVCISGYAFINAAVVLNLMPTTGIPMPFLSYGGSAMIVNLLSIGILLNLLAQIRRNRLLKPAKNIYYRLNHARRRR